MLFIAIRVELEDGITREHIFKMLDLLPKDAEVMPFSSDDGNSSAYGFITKEAFEEINYNENYLQDFLNPILENWDNESADNIYTMPNGFKLYIGCDYTTVL